MRLASAVAQSVGVHLHLHDTTVSTQTWVLYTGLCLELPFSKSGGVHNSQLHIPVRTGGIFYFPWPGHSPPDRRDRRHGIAKVPKRKVCPKWDSNPAGTVRSPVQANALTHSATAPPSVTLTRDRQCQGQGLVCSWVTQSRWASMGIGMGTPTDPDQRQRPSPNPAYPSWPNNSSTGSP